MLIELIYKEKYVIYLDESSFQIDTTFKRNWIKKNSNTKISINSSAKNYSLLLAVDNSKVLSAIIVESGIN